MGSLRESVKIKFEKPLFTRTNYGSFFINPKGSEKVGASNLDDEGKNVDVFRRTKPLGELEKFKDVPLKFSGISSSGLNYAGYGEKRLPTPNRLTYQTSFVGHGKFYGQTAYGEQFVKANTEDSCATFNLDRKRFIERQ